MQKRLVVLLVAFAAIAALLGYSFLPEDQARLDAAQEKYPPPRFPSYLKPPKSIEEVMPFARAAVRQTGGRTPLGLVEKGQTLLLVATDHVAEPMVLEAIRRAYGERGVKARIMKEHELRGLTLEEALAIRKATVWYTSEQGYFEADFSGNWSIEWLKKIRPELHAKLFPEIKLPEALTRKDREVPSLTKALIKYLDENPGIDAVYFARGGRQRRARELEHHREKMYGNFIFDNRWELMSKVPEFPGDVWRLVEERVIEPIGWIDKMHATDPEGTNLSMDVDEKTAEAWGKSAYEQGHLFMLPGSATGRFPYSVIEYPAIKKEYIPHFVGEADGVIAGTNNHRGVFPRIEVHVKKGYVVEVKGGGPYGDIWREAIKIPGINEVTWPFRDKPGYWWLREGGLGTNPKFYKRLDENLQGTNQTERNVAGVIHWGFGMEVREGPQGPTKPPEVLEFEKKTGLPNRHGWHIHNLLLTYRVKVRATKNTWLTLINKGRIAALDSPEIRALASRYGNPDEILRQDWVPHLPGINAPGKYEDYARDPWRTITMIAKKVEAGTYEYSYPPVKPVDGKR